jgi:hypothetical protein
MAQPTPPLFDPGNPPAQKLPAQLLTGEIATTEGKLGVATLRVPGTSLTVLLSRDEAASWAAAFQHMADQLTGLTVVRDGVPLPPLGAAPGQPI